MHLKGETIEVLSERWVNLPEEAPFFQKLRNIARYYRHISKLKAKEFKRRELDLRAKFEVTIALLHEDTHDPVKQRDVSRSSMAMDEIENRKARGATIRAKIKWQVVGDKCSA